ncbi:MAG: hypothetical protein H6862_03360 [Rhodospirillales bacterium]|nr:hypothetical protein [Rhodospirillales bacterium]
MSVSSDLAFQILEKIGAPLMRAIVAAPGQNAADPTEQARFLADLLGKSVHGGMALAGLMNINGPDDKVDSIRLGLTSLLCEVLAAQVRETGRAPTDRDIERYLSSFQALLSFADGFSGAADAADRLRTIDPARAFLLDETQIDALFLRAFAPVIEAVATFPFGHSDRKLVQDVCEKLLAESRRIARAVPAENPVAARRRELLVLDALCPLYAACHTAQTRRLMAMDAAARSAMAADNGGVLPMAPVWEAFALRVAMLESLANFPRTETGSITSGSDPAPEVVKPATSSPATTPTPPVPAQPQALQTPPDSGTFPQNGASEVNPMRFFKPGGKSS